MSFLLEDAIVQIMTPPLTLTVVSRIECQTKMRDYVLVKNWIKNPLTPHQHLTGQDSSAILVHAKGPAF